MVFDVRDIAHIDEKDVVGLNFIRSGGKYLYRRHYRQGLRSHILEVLDVDDVEIEKKGILLNGIFRFPKAKPKKMLRIFRTRLGCLNDALAEIQKVKITESYLTTSFIAPSTEIIVDYSGPDGRSPLLCGLQEYIEGVIFDPWNLLHGSTYLTVIYDSLAAQLPYAIQDRNMWIEAVQKFGLQFINNVKKMVLQGGYVPDLAGVGNVLITSSGKLKLVDINNVSEVFLDDTIRLDDREYPVCDKSLESLALIEEKILHRRVDLSDPLYGTFLHPERKEAVKTIERRFMSQFA